MEWCPLGGQAKNREAGKQARLFPREKKISDKYHNGLWIISVFWRAGHPARLCEPECVVWQFGFSQIGMVMRLCGESVQAYPYPNRSMK